MLDVLCVGQDVKSPGVSLRPEVVGHERAFMGLVETPNGKGVTYLLIRNRGLLGHRVVDETNVWPGEGEGRV